MTPIHTYKSKVASRYIPVEGQHIGLKIAESDYYLTSVKHDGHLAFLVCQKDKATLYDRTGDVLVVPAVTDAAAKLGLDMVLAGELCRFADNRSTSHREVSAALDEPQKFDLRFGAFDLLELNGESPSQEPTEKAAKLKELLGKSPALFAIEQQKFTSRKEVIAFFQKATEQQEEGIVVRVANGIVYKVKQMIHLDLVVLGFAESTGDRAGWLRELLVGFALGNNRYQLVGKCAGGFSDEERQSWPTQLSALTTPSIYTEVSGAKTAFQFVRPERVVEVSCLDLINETSDGAIAKTVLAFDAQRGFEPESKQPALSLISANYVRTRTDKQANEHDAGTAQAYSLCAPVMSAAGPQSNELSTIVAREVFTKVAKGATAVRKFVALKTNKEQSGLYAPYVVLYTDYSGGRKTPLEQELFLCGTEKEALAKVAALKEENIKKVWEAHS
jgi:hypothetical protein